MDNFLTYMKELFEDNTSYTPEQILEIQDEFLVELRRAVCVCDVNPLSEGLEYALNADGKSYSVSGIGTCIDSYIGIPVIHDGLFVTGIAENAFSGCSAESITLPISIMTIGNHAFSDCQKLKEINIPKTINTIGEGAFSLCPALKTFDFKSFSFITPPNVDLNNLFGEAEDFTITVRSQRIADAWKATSPWSDYAANFVVD